MSGEGVGAKARETKWWPTLHIRIPPIGIDTLKREASKRAIGVSSLVRLTLHDAGFIPDEEAAQPRGEQNPGGEV